MLELGTDDIPLEEGEELFTREAVDELIRARVKTEREKFKERIGAALKQQREQLLEMAATETRRLLKERP